MMHDRTKLLGSQVTELAIYRNTSPGVDRVCVVIIHDKLVVGILNLVKASLAALPLAIYQNAPPLLKSSLKIALVPPERPHLPGSVGSGDLKDPKLPAFDRVGSGDPHLNFDSRPHAVLQVADPRKVRAILVAHRQVVNQ